jgi:ERCC4-related helicase
LICVTQEFREGAFNVIVSTSIGEEGLDIGEVDLVVCFDASASPLRMIQRMGRTGRKRQGRVDILLNESRLGINRLSFLFFNFGAVSLYAELRPA